MPTRNTLKVYVADSYYHLYNRGWNKTEIFLDVNDYQYFESLLERLLSLEPTKDRKGREFTHLRHKLDLNAYCLMPNHFHMLIYQREENGITKLMSSLLTAYTMYFNKKYRRRGPLFESTYKAVRINSDPQLMHLSRYIHLNHKRFATWPYSSHGLYVGKTEKNWVVHQPILKLFKDSQSYQYFIKDYEGVQRRSDAIKWKLANS